MDSPVFEYAEILANWSTLPDVKIAYYEYTDHGTETGWAKALAPDIVCLANLPFDGPLRLYDIVTLEPPDDAEGFPVVGERLQAYFTTSLAIQYPRGTTEDATRQAYGAIRDVIEAVGGCTEGMIPGWAIANLPAEALEHVETLLSTQPGVTLTVFGADE
jgi:hypothetical protein